MLKRPKRNETEDDIVRMQEEFLKEKAKNPKFQPAAQFVKPVKKSIFAKNREQKQFQTTTTASNDVPMQNVTNKSQELLGEIHEKIVGEVNAPKEQQSMAEIVLGDVVEKHFSSPKILTGSVETDESAFPKVETTPLRVSPKKGKSIFALSMEAKMHKEQVEKENPAVKEQQQEAEFEKMDTTESAKNDLTCLHGASSAIVEDTATAAAVHKENLELLSQMKEEEILAERKRLLDSIDPTLVALLAKRRKEKAGLVATNVTHKNENMKSEVKDEKKDMTMKVDTVEESSLPSSSPAAELLQRSAAEQWIHFDVVEKDKLDWMRDIPLQVVKLKPGEQFEARFDWKGVLLPYSMEEVATAKDENDERELYLHGVEPHRPGYTLQELFRLARSNVIQQRVSAFNAIAGMLNIYNQGFYDDVLELPISKIFFLLRFGFDDNSPAMLEVVAKALAYLFYNETDETLLDFVTDNPGCYWQPTLRVLDNGGDSDDDPTSIENLQRQMQQLRIPNAAATIKANVNESEDESKTTMSDFQLAETDLIECLLRTNILQRIYFILQIVRVDNSTVSSCLKLLIRIARAGKDAAMQIVNNMDLLNCLCEYFLLDLQFVDTSQQQAGFYNYPQYLCLKLIRVLIAQNLGIAVKLTKMRLVEKLQNYLYNREDIKSNLIKVQIESLRILRCLLLLQVDNNLYKQFLPACRYMLEWHYNHVDYEVGGALLIRRHAAALLAAIATTTGSLETHTILGDTLRDCCCKWFHNATRNGVQEFSQATLLTACLNAVDVHLRYGDAERFRVFNERYLVDFMNSSACVEFVKSLSSSSILLRTSPDRRTMHAPLPNVGAVLVHAHGPQLIISQRCAVHLLIALWRLMETQLTRDQRGVFEAFTQPRIIESLVAYLRALGKQMNRYLATNFFAKAELKLVFQLLCFEGFAVYFDKSEMLQLVYNFLCCLTAEHIPEIEKLFERVIFNTAYLQVDGETLEKWRNQCLELVYAHYIVVPPTELTLSLPFSQVPILPRDWPYFQLKTMLQNYIDNVQHKPTVVSSESEVLRMTFTFVSELEKCNPHLELVTPTEQLMYLMIAFMGPDSQFLDREIQKLLRDHLMHFYEKYKNYRFQFDAVYEGKCKFENLYALFVDHFQAASYGNELFGSLLLLPLAQKYDNKWRRRVWSDYASALRFLNCDESLLIGGLQAYLEPVEEEESLVKAYRMALIKNLVRSNTIPYKIAKYHTERFIRKENAKN